MTISFYQDNIPPVMGVVENAEVARHPKYRRLEVVVAHYIQSLLENCERLRNR